MLPKIPSKKGTPDELETAPENPLDHHVLST